MPASASLRSTQLIAVLAVTQLIGWGTTFDMVGALGRVIAPDLGLANEIVFGGLTIMMIVSALSGPTAGRWLARYGAARVLAASSVTLAGGLLLLSMAQGIVVYAIAWTLFGIGGALGLTAPAYTAVVEREGDNSKRVIAILMLFTGLSGAIFWPILSLLNAHLGWRSTFLLCAALHVCICLPLHLFCLPHPIDTGHDHAEKPAAPPPLPLADRRKAFILIATATTISTFVTFGLPPSLLEIFRQYGASPALALQIASARGVVGMSARLLDMVLGKRGNPVISAIVGVGLMVLSFGLMIVLPPSTSLLVIFMLLCGFGSGVMAVARALLPLALFSPQDYGLHSSRLLLPQNLANAVAPVVFTAILDRTSAVSALAAAAVLVTLSLGSVIMLAMLVRGAVQPVPSPP
jgi:predicted MFS family arabinose efflux permease